MERMRWLPTLDDHPNVFVNVPLFRLWADDPVHRRRPLRMNVVVGKSLNHQTPIFVEQMEIRDLPPVLESAAEYHGQGDPAEGAARSGVHGERGPGDRRRAIRRALRRCLPTPENLTLVAAGKLRCVRGRARRTRSGLAKFIFPNDENVYMHGTPAPQLFSRARRDFSHGCIRLEDPARFAEWVLRDQPEWTRARIDQAMQGERPTRVNLKEPLTVVLFYDTVHVNSENVVFFVDDIYGHDRALDALLAQGYPYPVRP